MYVIYVYDSEPPPILLSLSINYPNSEILILILLWFKFK